MANSGPYPALNGKAARKSGNITQPMYCHVTQNAIFDGNGHLNNRQKIETLPMPVLITFSSGRVI
jgi:hypothetical protein